MASSSENIKKKHQNASKRTHREGQKLFRRFLDE